MRGPGGDDVEVDPREQGAALRSIYMNAELCIYLHLSEEDQKRFQYQHWRMPLDIVGGWYLLWLLALEDNREINFIEFFEFHLISPVIS